MEINLPDLLRRIKKDMPGYLFVVPAILLFGFFSLKPMIEGITFSFFEVSVKERTFMGLANYIKLIQDVYFWMELKNTLIFALMIIPSALMLSLGIALIIFRFSHRTQSFLWAAFYLPNVTAGVVMSIVWLWIFNPLYGLLNYLISFVGLKPVMWLSEANPARVAVSIVALNWVIGWNIILYLAALARIPKTLHESAEIDGANTLQKFMHITVPLIAPTTTYVLIILTVGVFQIWGAIYLLTAGGPAYATTSFVYRIYQLGFMYFRFGEASTHAVILLLMVFSVAIMQFRYLNRQLEF